MNYAPRSCAVCLTAINCTNLWRLENGLTCHQTYLRYSRDARSSKSLRSSVANVPYAFSDPVVDSPACWDFAARSWRRFKMIARITAIVNMGIARAAWPQSTRVCLALLVEVLTCSTNVPTLCNTSSRHHNCYMHVLWQNDDEHMSCTWFQCPFRLCAVVVPNKYRNIDSIQHDIWGNWCMMCGNVWPLNHGIRSAFNKNQFKNRGARPDKHCMHISKWWC